MTPILTIVLEPEGDQLDLRQGSSLIIVPSGASTPVRCWLSGEGPTLALHIDTTEVEQVRID